MASSLAMAHNYDHLARRWQKVARMNKMAIKEFATVAGYPLLVLCSKSSRRDLPRMYFSAGIHGDEAAATEGLVEWAENNPEIIREIDATIFPCLNPWGLVNNSRLDHRGRDLNRCYHAPTQPIRAQIREIEGRTFDVAMAFHEDFDATGIYIYEIASAKPHWAEKLLTAATPHVPVDRRNQVEGRAASAGVIRRRIRRNSMAEWPEAFLLHFQYARRTFTVETPSEFHIQDRVRAQVAVIEMTMTLALAEWHASRSSGSAR
ncbi:MAG: M14 family metallopeptidase [Terrimicrobiaceae bacterium]